MVVRVATKHDRTTWAWVNETDVEQGRLDLGVRKRDLEAPVDGRRGSATVSGAASPFTASGEPRLDPRLDADRVDDLLADPRADRIDDGRVGDDVRDESREAIGVQRHLVRPDGDRGDQDRQAGEDEDDPGQDAAAPARTRLERRVGRDRFDSHGHLPNSPSGDPAGLQD